MRSGLLVALLLALAAGPVSAGDGDGEIFYPEKAEISAFPREVSGDGSLLLAALLKRGFHTPVLAVTHPKGTTEYFRPARAPAADRVEFDVDFRGGSGPYRIELVVDSDRGDTTAARFTVWVGMPRPPAEPGAGDRLPESAFPDENPEESTVRLERDFFRLLNGYRREQGLPPYPWLEKAALLAREHMTDYLALSPRPDKLTHLIPGKGSIADRFEDFFAWPPTVRKFPVAEPEIGPEAVGYCSESLAAPRSLEWLFREVYLRDPAFRAPVLSKFPTHAAVGIVREPATGRLYTATVFVQVNSTRVQGDLRREEKDLEKAEARAREDAERCDALRALARFSTSDCLKAFSRRRTDRSPEVRAAALDGLFLNDLGAAEEWVGAAGRVVARAFERERYGPAVPVLRTFAAVEWDARVRAQGRSALAALGESSETELDAALGGFLRGQAGAREALAEIALRYAGLPAADVAAARLRDAGEPK